MLSVLGSLQVDLTTGEDVRGSKRRTLLAALLAHTPEVVPTDVLLDLLWRRTPASAAANLRTYVADLRRLLARGGSTAEVVHTEAGYALVAAPDEVDFLLFERRVRTGLRLLRDGEPGPADRVLDEALELWRGTPFSDVELGAYLPSRVCALEELRWEALGASAGARMHLGRPSDAAAQLRVMVLERPHCEHSRAQLMTVLNVMGRRAEALDVFDVGRRLLRDDLGLDADEEMQRALSQVLAGQHRGAPPVEPAGDPARESPSSGSPGPCTLLARQSTFVGDECRTEELAGWLSTPAPRPRVLSLVGPVGAGKTVLATELAHRVSARFPDGRLFVPLHEDGRPREAGSVIAEVLVLLGTDRSQLDASPTDLAAQLRARLARRRVLLVLDGAGGPDQVRGLLPGTGESAALVTSRRSTRAIDGLREEPVLGIDETLGRQLLAAVLGAPRVQEDPGAVRRIVEVCDGLPLALRIVAERLHTRPSLSLAALADRLSGTCRLDELVAHDLSVRTAIHTAYVGLDAEVQHLLIALLSSPSGMTVPQVAALCDWPEPGARMLVERLQNEGLLTEHPGRGADERYSMPTLWAATLRDLVDTPEREPSNGRLAAARPRVHAVPSASGAA